MLHFFWTNRMALLVLGLTGYFLVNMFGGHNGLWAQWHIRQRLEFEKARLEQLNKDREKLDKKVLLLAPDRLAEDYLDELSRKMWGYVQKDERILWLENSNKVKKRP